MGFYHSSAARPAQYSDIFPLAVPLWEDLRVGATVVKLGAAKPPVWKAYGDFLVLAFEDQGVAGNEQRVHFQVQFPHTYVEGSTVEAHVHWIGEDTTAGNVVWKLDCIRANEHVAMANQTTHYSVAANNAALAEAHNVGEFSPNMVVGDRGISSMMLCTLRRNSSNVADTFNGKDAYLLEYDLHFLVDTLGSLTEHTK